jgi:protein-disulfide isomerase
VTSEDPALGRRDARVTVVMFVDLQCPYCKKVQPTIRQLRERYGDDLRVVWKDLPLEFHKNAFPAAVAARVAFLAQGSGAFFHVVDRMFENAGQLSPDNYARWLAEVGVDRARYDALARQAEAKVQAGVDEAKRLGVQGTPNFLIDGEAITGAQPYEKFDAIVVTHLRKAAELEARGVPRAGLYEEMTRLNFKAPSKAEGEAAAEPEPDDFTVWEVQVGDAPALGKADAPITIVTFGDFQCPFCKRLEATLGQVRKTYGDKVRLVFKNNPLPFHNRALAGAAFALEARAQKGDDGFWRAHDALYESQPKLEAEDLEGLAKNLGLDWGKVDAAIKNDKWKARIEADLDQAEAIKVTGTPTSFVNGRLLNGALPFERFQHMIDQELPKAKALVDAGTPAAGVYAATIKGGKSIKPTPLVAPAWAPWRGGKDAKVVIHVFGDYQCPFCKRLQFDTPDAQGKIDPSAAGLKAAVAKYGDKIKIVWRNFPLSFHDRAEPPAQFAICAFKTKGNDVFWKVHDELFASSPALADGDIERIAKKHGVDWPTCKKAIDQHAYKTEIDQDMADGGGAGVTGTPASIINGRSIVGAQSFDIFQKRIDAAIAGK